MASVFEKKGYKLFVHMAYGIGAAMVIAGALFKIMHWQGAGSMLTLGMLTECVIFIISAFEPMPKDYDWAKVFPEFNDGNAAVPATSGAVRQVAASGAVAGGGVMPSVDLNISSETSENLKLGVQKLSDSLNQFSSLSNIAQATETLSGTLQKASSSVNAFNESAVELGFVYKQASQTMNGLSEQTKLNADQLRVSYSGYKEQMEALGNSISTVNASFEVYLQENNKLREKQNNLQNEVGRLVGNLQQSIDETSKFGAQMAAVNSHVAQLNNVYGSMLSAVNSAIK